MSSNYSIDESNGTLLVCGLSRDAAHRNAQRHAARTGETVRVYEEGGSDEWLVPPPVEGPAELDSALTELASWYPDNAAARAAIEIALDSTPINEEARQHRDTQIANIRRLIEARSVFTDPPAIVDPDVARLTEAMSAYLGGDPDAVPEVELRGAWRDLSCKMSGSETLRRVRFPGAHEGDGEWLSDRLPAAGVRASERRCETRGDIPIGSLVQDLECVVNGGRKHKAVVRFALVTRTAEGKAKLEWLNHRVLRKRPVYEIELPGGHKTEWPRRV